MSEDVFSEFLDPNGDPQNCIADCQSPSDWLIFARITKTLNVGSNALILPNCRTFIILCIVIDFDFVKDFVKNIYIVVFSN